MERAIVETLELVKPVEYEVRTAEKKEKEKRTLDHLDFARLTAADIEDIPTTDQKVKDFFLPLSRSTEVPVAVLRKLDSADLMAAIRVIGGFLGNGQETGESL